MPRITITDEAFKKAEQVVDRPPVTRHDINDEYMRHPPHNHDSIISAQAPKKPSIKEAVYEREPVEPGVIGDQGLGKQKKEEELAEILNDDSVTRRMG